MKTETPIENLTVKELQLLVRQAGVAGWHDMRRPALVALLGRLRAAEAKGNGSRTKGRAKEEPAGKLVSKKPVVNGSARGTVKNTPNKDTANKDTSKTSRSEKTGATAKKAATKIFADKVSAGKLPAGQSSGTKSSKAPSAKTAGVKTIGTKVPPVKPAPVKAPSSPARKKSLAKSAKEAAGKDAAIERKPETRDSRDRSAKKKTTVVTASTAVELSDDTQPSGRVSDNAVLPGGNDTGTGNGFGKEMYVGAVGAHGQESGDDAVRASETTGSEEKNTGFPAPSPEVQKKISTLKEKLLLQKTLGTDNGMTSREARNQLMLMVRDPFWLHAYWEISTTLVDRIRAAMAHLWHTAEPVLRLYRMNSDTDGTLRKEFISDIRIHGGINNWYIDVEDPPSSFLVEIGYLARDGQFFILLSSNIAETPPRYVHDSFGHPGVSWTSPGPQPANGYLENGFGDYRSFNSKAPVASRPFSNGAPVKTGSSALAWSDSKKSFAIELDAEVVIKGRVTPHVQLTVKGENIRLRDDGTFSIRYQLPERRHVFPVAAVSPDGVETKTIILAVERNTKILETVVRDEDDE